MLFFHIQCVLNLKMFNFKYKILILKMKWGTKSFREINKNWNDTEKCSSFRTKNKLIGCGCGKDSNWEGGVCQKYMWWPLNERFCIWSKGGEREWLWQWRLFLSAPLTCLQLRLAPLFPLHRFLLLFLSYNHRSPAAIVVSSSPSPHARFLNPSLHPLLWLPLFN